jgi:hypothetical protein
LFRQTKSQTEDQLRIIIKFLDFITGKKSIASTGYRLGLRQLETQGRKFAKAIAEDKTFLVQYVYLLDCTFNHFCKELMTHARGKHPISHRPSQKERSRQVSRDHDPGKASILLASRSSPKPVSSFRPSIDKGWRNLGSEQWKWNRYTLHQRQPRKGARKPRPHRRTTRWKVNPSKVAG